MLIQTFVDVDISLYYILSSFHFGLPETNAKKKLLNYINRVIK